jgi:hypothetical protein
MTAIPSQVLPLPATDATVTVGLPEAGLSTRLDPSTAITQGVVGGRKFGGRVMNWILGGFGDWLAYLREADGISLTDNEQPLQIPIASVVASSAGFALKGNLYGSSPHYEPALEQQSVAGSFVWDLSSVLPRNAMMTRVSIDVQAETGYSTNPTGTEFPAIGLFARNWADNSISTIIAPVYDAPVNVAAYKTRHTMSLDFTGTGLIDMRNLAIFSGNYYRSIYLVVLGAQGGSFAQGNVLFTNPLAYLRSYPWV